MATDHFLKKNSVLGLAERVVLSPPTILDLTFTSFTFSNTRNWQIARNVNISYWSNTDAATYKATIRTLLDNGVFSEIPIIAKFKGTDSNNNSVAYSVNGLSFVSAPNQLYIHGTLISNNANNDYIPDWKYGFVKMGVYYSGGGATITNDIWYTTFIPQV